MVNWPLTKRAFWAVVLLFGADLSAQSDRRSTFHISGVAVTLSGQALANLWVTFEGAGNTSVKTDSAGHYETDLPTGVWQVAVTTSSTSRIARDCSLTPPRLFRVSKPSNVVLDLDDSASMFCTIALPTEDGRPTTPEQVQERDDYCAGRKFFSVPSDGIPFEVVIGGIGLARDVCSDFGRNPGSCGRQFGAYNLLTVQADNVTFDPSPEGGLLEAKGDVVVTDGHREYRRKSVRFLVGDGRAIEVQ